MINGITILNEYESNYLIYVIWFFIGVVLLLILNIFLSQYVTKKRTIYLFTFLAGILWSGIWLPFSHLIPGITIHRYHVNISNEVKFLEFNEKYTVINQEGNIYTIEEKDS